MRSACALLAGALLALALTGCDRRQGAAGTGDTVVLYVSADPHVYEPVVEAFEDASGIRVQVRTDSEATKTTGLIQRLRAERDSPVADVLWSSEVFLTIQLAGEGLLQPAVGGVFDGWPPALRDRGARWHGFGSRARVIVYHTERITGDAVPKTMHDLLDPRFNGRIAMARPAFGTTRGHMGALLTLWGEDRFEDWLQRLEDNGVRLYDGNSTVVRAVANGEADVGLTDTDDVWSGQANGWAVDAAYARHDAPASGDAPPVTAGPLLIPNTVALIAGGPNPDAATTLAEFLLSERVERMLAASDSHNIPVRESLRGEFARYWVEDGAQIDYAAVAGAMGRALELCDEHLR